MPKSLLLCLKGIFLLLIFIFVPNISWAGREISYDGTEQVIYVRPGEPTQVIFPTQVEGGFKPKEANFALEKQDNSLVIFPRPELSQDGESAIVYLDDKRSYALRFIPASEDHPRDSQVVIFDSREPEIESEEPTEEFSTPGGFAPPTFTSGLMREMILHAEFGINKGIPGYRRSNKYSGETVLNDGAVEVKIDEIYMGANLWGYVLTAENKLDTTQKLNPATFRLDGTKAVSAQRWELAPRPLTEEQRASGSHEAKIYVVTRSKPR